MRFLAFCLSLNEEPKGDQACDQGLSDLHPQPCGLESLVLGLISLCETVVLGINAAARHRHQFRELTQAGRLINTFHHGTSPGFLWALPTWAEDETESPARSDCVLSGMCHEQSDTTDGCSFSCKEWGWI